MSDPVTLLLGEVSTETMIDHLVGGLGCQPAPVVDVERTFLDTFDWRLWNAGLVLEHETIGDRSWLRLRGLGQHGARHQASCAVAPISVFELAPSELRDDLAGPVGVRALLPVAHTRGVAETFRYLNRQRKTVARIVVQTNTVVDPNNQVATSLEATVSVVPVRGYPRPYARALEAVTDLIGSEPAPDALLRAAASTARPVGSYRSGIDLDLDHVDNALSAVGVLVAAVRASMVANQPGIEAATDTEFLHDYRRALQRLVSVLDEATALYPEAALEELLTELRLLERLTSTVRRYDIVLLALRDGPGELLPLTSRVIERHSAARTELLAAFGSERYSNVLSGLTELETAAGPEGADPVEFATQRIAKAHRRLVKRGRKTSDGEQLRPHALRLHHLLETFVSVLDRDATRVVARDLDRFVDVLERIGELTLEIDELHAVGVTLTGAEPRTLMAIGARIERLGQARAISEKKLVKRLAALASPAVTAALAALDPRPSAT